MKKSKLKYIIFTFCLLVGLLVYSLNINSINGYCEDTPPFTQSDIDSFKTNYAGNKTSDSETTPKITITVIADEDNEGKKTALLVEGIPGADGTLPTITDTYNGFPWTYIAAVRSDVTKIIFTGEFNVIELHSTFHSCMKLREVIFERDENDYFNTSTLNHMYDLNAMFYNCQSLKKVDFGKHFDISSVKQMGAAFQSCTSLEEIVLDNLSKNNTNTIDFSNTFHYCISLKDLTFGSKDYTLKINSHIRYLDALENLTLNNIIFTDAVTSFDAWYYQKTKLKTVTFNNVSASKVTTMGSMFNGCTNLETANIQFKDLNTTAGISLRRMFKDCSNLSSLTFKSTNSENKFSDMSETFINCSNLETIDLSTLNTADVTTMENMFSGCTKLKELNISSFTFNAEANVDGFLTNCSSLTKIYLPQAINGKVITLPTGTFSKWYYNDGEYAGTVLPEASGEKTYIELKTIIQPIPDQTYTGEQIKPSVTLTGLSEGTDYTLSYGENIEVGSSIGTVTITGKGTYASQTQTVTFNIIPQQTKKRKKKKVVTEDSEKEETKTEEIKTEEKTEEEIEKENYEKVKEVSHIDKAYVNGYDDATFKPTKNLSRAEVAAMLSRLSLQFDSITNYTSYNDSFSDLEKSDWYDNYIGYCIKSGYLNGYEDMTFRPNESMTRAEFTVAIKRMYDVILNSNNIDKTNFSDISGEWYEEEIKIMASNNYIKGCDNNYFNGDREITRAEACKIINNVIKRLENIKDKTIINTYSDVKESDWYYEDIISASTNIN